MTTLISVVSPVYRAENIVDELVNRLETELEKISGDYEIILVEDGSPDKSWEKIEANCKRNPKVKGIQLSRNFGQHHAITAGLEYATGEWIVVMDCDLQDTPEEISKMYNKAISGYDLVVAKRIFRKDSFQKKFSSKIFYKLFSYLSGIKQDATIANFGIYNKTVINAVKKINEPMRAFPMMVNWVGFKKGTIDVIHCERKEGTTSYTWSKLIALALNIILAHSDKPLKLTIKLGFILSASSLLIAIYFIYNYFVNNVPIRGYTSLIFSIWFLSGLIIFILGIIGLYLSKIFETVKNRPLYIIKQKI